MAARPQPHPPHPEVSLSSTAPRSLRRGDAGVGVRAVRLVLARLGRLPVVDGLGQSAGATGDDDFDLQVDGAVRGFQQERGLTVDGVVGSQTWAALQAAGRTLGSRLLSHTVSNPLHGDDVAELQRRLISMGFDVGRLDGVFRSRTQRALQAFQREQGLRDDGICGPLTLRALARLDRAVRGGNAHELREAERLRRSGPSLVGRTLVIDPGHGGDDLGVQAHDLTERDVVWDIARRLEGRLQIAGVDVVLTRGAAGGGSEMARARVANASLADLVVSLHTDGTPSASPSGAATYFYGSGRDSPSVVGARLADLVQKEVVARTDLLDCRTHPKTWDLLRLTRMPAVRLEVGTLTNSHDALRLGTEAFRDVVADAVMVAVQRLFLPVELDPPTGAMRVPLLRTPQLETMA